ncbi:MAG: hypothetical protein A2Z06_05160 [Candidatus Glassbacteria bacterium RBG_16_58_8]|uniref:Response regulatory domain-containing protein n=1 Tax=Candidatus Glassbacteria bacterium RBG_16_58_8 TaxID=1817866 RepID=A0A1F5YDC6_9BACT|nr:MAG: hypothetical protein A2Z06_05160 [Candidatus Glassbacteria bacterium RBG_16_58_8]
MGTKKILVVDDEPNIVRMLESRLKASGYEVITASNGLEALNTARSEKPDLIILDIMLPEMDGYKVCAMLKYDIEHSRIPIIMLTARAHESDRKLGAELGVQEYIVKPFDGKELMKTIEKHLARSRR